MDIQKAFNLVEILKTLATSDNFAAFMVDKDNKINDKYNCDIEDIKHLLTMAAHITKDNFASQQTYNVLRYCEEKIINTYGHEIINNNLIFDQNTMGKLKEIYEKNTELASRLIEVVKPIKSHKLKNNGKG